MTTIAVLVPSRGRPNNIDRLRQAWADTGTAAGLVVRIDDDDSARLGYEAPFHMGPRLRLGGTLNTLGVELAERFDVVGFMGDDHVPRTPGWDKLVAESYADGAEVIYGNDLVHGEGLPTAVFLSARIVRTLGYMVPPGLIHLFMDNYWLWLGRQLGTIRYLPEMVIEHMHPLVGKAPDDARYAEVNSGEVWAHDEGVFQRWVAEQSAGALAALRAAR